MFEPSDLHKLCRRELCSVVPQRSNCRESTLSHSFQGLLSVHLQYGPLRLAVWSLVPLRSFFVLCAAKKLLESPEDGLTAPGQSSKYYAYPVDGIRTPPATCRSPMAANVVVQAFHPWSPWRRLDQRMGDFQRIGARLRVCNTSENRIACCGSRFHKRHLELEGRLQGRSRY